MSDIKIDYDYYAGTYGGGASEETFTAGIAAARAVIDALLYPWSADDFDTAKRGAYRTAVCMQLDFMRGAPSDTADSAGRRIKSERLGDRSVTYELSDNAASGRLSVHGSAVSPEAAAVLGNAGCLCRWI